ncbi:MAG: hypothetical protein IT436_08690 [Phycisphaerales bacterium]|nr:hypothetical protein [Phycisphaerales bacterium]
MLKILRKYKNWFLAIGGTLLMVSFLTPQAVQQLHGDPAKRVIATLGEEKIRAMDLQKASFEYKALERFNELLLKQTLEVENSDHWFLLTREAERAGMVGEYGDGETFLPMLVTELTPRLVEERYYQQFQSIGPEFARQFARQMAGQEMQDPEKRRQAEAQVTQMLAAGMMAGMGESRMTEQEFYRALAKARGVLRLINSYAGAARVSDRHAVYEAAQRADATYADIVLIPADRALEGIPEPTPEQLKANFDQFRDVTPGQGDFGIGYRLADRTRIEWLELDRAVFEAAVNVDPVEVRKRQTKDRVKDPAGFAEERAKIEADLKNEQVALLLTEAQQIIKSQISGQVRKLESDSEFRKLPADWATTRIGWESIAQKVVEGLKASRGVTIPLPKVVSKAEWLSAEQISALPGIGQAMLRSGPRNMPVAEALLDVKELGGKGAGIGLQALIPQIEPPAQDAAQNRYYFTVLDARKASAPESIDEVRDQVVKNTRLLLAYEKLKAEAGRYKDLAVSDGLEAVARLFDVPAPAAEPGKEPPPATPPLTVRKGVGISRDQVIPQDQTLDRPEFREAIRAVGAKLDPLKPADVVPVSDRAVAVPLPQHTSLAVAVVIGRKPLTEETYRRFAGRQIEGLSMEELRAAAGDKSALEPFSYKALAERLGFKLKREET